MNKLKKYAALCLALVIAVGSAGCVLNQDKAYVAELEDGTKIPAGVYLTYMMDEYTYVLDEVDPEAKDPLKETLEDGTLVSAKIMAEAKQALSEHIAVEQKFKELGLELTDEDKQIIDLYAVTYWEAYFSQIYEANNISQSSYYSVMENASKRNALFDAVYGEGGEQEVSESELQEKFYNDYTKVILVPLTFSTDEDAEAKAEADQKARDFIDKYYQMALGNRPFEEYVAPVEEEEETEGEEIAPEDTSSSEPEAPADGETDPVEPADEPTEETPEKAPEETPADEPTEDEPTPADDDGLSLFERIYFEARKEATGNTELERPEPGDSFTLIGRDSTSYSEEVLNAFFTAPLDTPTVIESEDGIYLFVRYDIKEDPEDFEVNKASLLSVLKGDEFEELVKDWAANLQGATLFQSSIDHYDPKKLIIA